MVKVYNQFLKPLIVITILWHVSGIQCRVQGQELKVSVHLRGVFESKIALLALSASGVFKPCAEATGVKNGGTAILAVPRHYLPGEFFLRFEYREMESSTPYPAEKRIFINDQELEIWVNPIYSSNPDSTWFQEDERENHIYQNFSKENSVRKEKISVLQSFLLNYDETSSELYLLGVSEYEKKRNEYNHWLQEQISKNKHSFTACTFPFYHIPELPGSGTEKERISYLIEHYFDEIDFSNPWIIRTSEINKWMDNYVNLYGQLATSQNLLDSLFPIAGITSVEKARQGHPLVYGWMVDYFYKGYEANNIMEGIKILEPYLQDPGCLTSKRREIERRMKGFETLVIGMKAPDISLNYEKDSLFNLYRFQTDYKYILILFWSAGCDHCNETVNDLLKWHMNPLIKQKVKILAISMDETQYDISQWRNRINQLNDWIHLNAEKGVNSKVAEDYFILSIPVMVLLESESLKIAIITDKTGEVKKIIR